MAQQRIPNIRLRSWRDGAHMTRAEFADAINRSTTGQTKKLYCDEERIRRWEAGEVLWPSPDYRKALCEVTELDPMRIYSVRSGNPQVSALARFTPPGVSRVRDSVVSPTCQS